MSDIPIIFSTNAPETEAQVAAATNAVEKSEQAAKKHNKTHEDGAKHADKAALSWKNLGRGFGQLGREISHVMGHGGTLGAAVAGYIAFTKALEISNFLLEHHKEEVKNVAEAHLKMAQAVRQAADETAKSGANAAGAQGASITRLVGQGGNGLAMANAFTKSGSGSATEVQQAMIEAKTKFGANAESAMFIASRAAKAGGLSIGEGIKNLSANELGDPSLAASRLLAVGRGDRSFSAQELFATEDRLKANTTTAALGQLREISGQKDVVEQGNIPLAMGQARADLGAARNPLTKIMLDQYNTDIQALSVLQQIRDSQSNIESIFDRIMNPEKNASVTANKAGIALGAGL